MNILFDASVLNSSYTGVAKTLIYLYENCKRLDESFKAYGIFCEKNIDFKSSAISLLDINSYKGKTKKQKISSIIEERKIEAIHYPNNYGVKYKFENVKNILTLHDVIPLENKNAIRNPLRKAYYNFNLYQSLKKSDKIVTVSQYSKKSIVKYTGCKKDIEVIYWGATLPDCSNKENKLEYDYYLYLGGFDRRKGIDIVVKNYYELIKQKATSAKLVLVGERHALDLQTDQLIDKGIEEGNIVITGYISDEEVCMYLQNAICLLYLSFFEGFGLPIIEAYKNKCPVITTKGTCLPEIAGDAAKYVERENDLEIQNAMKRFANDSNYRDCQIKKGLERMERFSWNRTASVFLDILYDER